MEGIFFYWFCWIGWIYSTFIMKRSFLRTAISYGLLLSIVCTNFTFTFYSFNFSGSYFIILVFALLATYFLSKLQILSLLVATLTVTAAYVAFHLFAMYDPVWMITNRQWLLSGLLCLLVTFLSESFQIRVLALMVGSSQGEWLYTLMLYPYSYNGSIGGFVFLDVIATTVGAFMLWTAAERMILTITRFKHRTFSERQ